MENRKNPIKQNLKNKINIKIVLLIAGVLSFVLIYQKRESAHQLLLKQQEYSTDTGRVRVIMGSEAFASDCIRIKAILQEYLPATPDKDGKIPDGKEANKSGVLLKVRGVNGNPITLFKTPNCGVEGLPSLSIYVPPGTTQQEFYTTTEVPGAIRVEATNTKDIPIPLSGSSELRIVLNPRKFKIAFAHLPMEILEFRNFSVFMEVRDFADKPLQRSEFPVVLELYSNDPKTPNLKLGTAQVKDGKVEFHKVYTLDVKEKTIRLVAKMGDSTVLSPPITKGEFVPRVIVCDVEDRGRISVMMLRPWVIEAFHEVFIIDRENGNTVTFRGETYEVEIMNADLVYLRKKRRQ